MQASENAALGETIRAALVNVGETLTKIDAAANAELPALPQQIASNAALGAELAQATALVGETLTKVGATAVPVDAFVSNASDAGQVVRSDAIGTIASTQVVRDDAIGTIASTQAPAANAELPALPQQIASTAVPVDAFVSNASDAGQVVRSDAIGTIASTQAPAAPAAPAQSEPDDAPEATADALVAAGVAPQVVVPATSGEMPLVQTVSSVASVDAVSSVAAAAPSADVLVQAASAVADTLLVSPGLLRGQGEVIVQLRPDVLDGTEVTISAMGRQLEVVFQPRTVDMAVLIENCRTQLVQHLSAKIATFNVSVDVRKKRS